MKRTDIDKINSIYKMLLKEGGAPISPKSCESCNPVKISMMKKIRILNLLTLSLIVMLSGAVVRASDASDVRSTVQNVFEQLKSRNYSELYDLLPDASRNRISR